MGTTTYQIGTGAIKSNPKKLRWINVVFLSIFLFSGVLMPTNLSSQEQSGPLLLSSGMIEAREAELRVVLWFESETPPEKLKKSLPQEGWQWKESYRYALGRRAYTLSGFKIIRSEEEKQLYLWFQGLAKKVKNFGGIAYLDEKVPEGIDIANYSIQQGIIPIQWSLSESTLSVTGQKSGLYPMVRAGADAVNIQVISQSHAGKGKTALAIPVLLEEF